MKVCPSKKEDRFSGVLEPAHKVLGELIVILSSQSHVQWHHIGDLKLAMEKLFTP